MKEKRIFDLSPIEKKVGLPTSCLAAILNFPLWRGLPKMENLAPEIIPIYRPSGGQITKNLVGVVFISQETCSSLRLKTSTSTISHVYEGQLLRSETIWLPAQ